MSKDYISKTKLAAVLGCTRRTLTNYVKAGLLPASESHGREVGWSVDVLRNVIAVAPGAESRALSENALRRIEHALNDFELTASKPSDALTDSEISNLESKNTLPEPILVDGGCNPENEFRRTYIERIKDTRETLAYLASESRQAKSGSQEKSELWNRVSSVRCDVDYLEGLLAENFVHLHSGATLIGTREVFSSPIFNVRNRREARQDSIKTSFRLTNGNEVYYEGPELRQDDSLVFMALLNIARDVRVGKIVGFSATELCETLFGYYSGPARSRLKTTISRLQGGILHFPSFRVQLVQRFEFPERGIWAVSLDADIVRMMTKESVVWLDLQYRLSLSCGLSSWLYAYIRSQTTLIPTKVERLRQLSGSEGALNGFRESLKTAMNLLAAGQHVDVGWNIDKHDLLRWRKVLKT